MHIQIEFKKTYQISAGTNRDWLVATIKNETYFFSGESLQFIEVDIYDEIKIPKTMPNNEFTAIFSSSSESFGDFSNAMVVGNFMTNLLLSGTMTYLWGLLNNI